MKTNKTVTTILIVLVLGLGFYAWQQMKQPVPGFVNYETQRVEELANPTAAFTEETAAVEQVEVSIDAELDALEAQSF